MHNELNYITINKIKKYVKKIESLPKNIFKNDKDFNKALIKQHIKFGSEVINRYGVYSLINFDYIFECRFIEDVVAFTILNQKATVNEKIKYIKNLNVDIFDILVTEKSLLRIIFLINNNDDLGTKKEYTDLFSIALNSLLLIKVIKFGLGSNKISHISKDEKIKKIKCKYPLIFTSENNFTIALTNLNEKIIPKISYLISDQIDNVLNTRVNNINSVDYKNRFSNMVDNVIESEFENILYTLSYSRDNQNLEMGLLDKYINEIEFNLDLRIIDLDSTVFRNRKVLTPKDGVILKVINTTIESIFLKEFYFEQSNFSCIGLVTRYKNGVEIANIIPLKIKDTEKIEILFRDFNESSENDYDPLVYIKDFLEIEVNSNLKYEIISPYYWKYRDRNYCSEEDYIKNNGKIKRKYAVEIAPFLRKINGIPSQDAINLAKRIGLDLEDGYTIVKEHIRNY